MSNDYKKGSEQDNSTVHVRDYNNSSNITDPERESPNYVHTEYDLISSGLSKHIDSKKAYRILKNYKGDNTIS